MKVQNLASNGAKKIAAETAAEICTRVTLSEVGAEALKDGMTPEAFIERLLELKAYDDAARMLAAGLPAREAVWWACLCTRDGLDARGDPKEAEALDAAEQWVVKPTEERRRRAKDKSELAGSSSPGGWAAMAAFFSRGSIAPEGMPEVKVEDPSVFASMVLTPYLMAAYADRESREEVSRRLVLKGLDIAAGGSGRET